MKAKTKINKYKIRYDRIFECIFVIVLIALGCYRIFTIKLTNIYIRGTINLKDQDIIELASLENYPKMINIDPKKIEKTLKKQNEIDKVSVKKGSSSITIEIDEAKPLYYDNVSKKNVLSNQKSTLKSYNLPILVNYVPDTIIVKFNESLSKINDDVLTKISEIKYDPNIDNERFLLTMNDGNYVYINLKRFDLLNNYLTIISNFKDEKGIIYLDSGSHFKLFDKNES